MATDILRMTVPLASTMYAAAISATLLLATQGIPMVALVAPSPVYWLLMNLISNGFEMLLMD